VDSPLGALVPRLAIVSHVVHYQHDGQLHAYGPYAREIDVWASLFPEVVIVSPLRHAPPPADAAPLAARNVVVRAFPESGGVSAAAKLWQAVRAPWLAWRLWRLLGDANAIHVRCPGNVGLLGALVAPLRSRRLVAKYAGQWGGYAGEAATVRWQRWLLRSRWWRGPVTVYGRHPSDPPHIVSFFTASFTGEQLARARRSAAARPPAPTPPYRVLFVGRLSAAKRAHVVLEAVAQLPATVVSACTIVGDGPERARLEAQGAGDPRVRFAGALPFADVLAQYEQHDVLVLVSETEGWPKVVHEAQAFGMRVVTRHDSAAGNARPAPALFTAADVARAIACPPPHHAGAPGNGPTATYDLNALGKSLQALLSQLWSLPE
jgi:glycosyltransferase involved in cell wall biosynthesis